MRIRLGMEDYLLDLRAGLCSAYRVQMRGLAEQTALAEIAVEDVAQVVLPKIEEHRREVVIRSPSLISFSTDM